MVNGPLKAVPEWNSETWLARPALQMT